MRLVGTLREQRGSLNKWSDNSRVIAQICRRNVGPVFADCWIFKASPGPECKRQIPESVQLIHGYRLVGHPRFHRVTVTYAWVRISRRWVKMEKREEADGRGSQWEEVRVRNKEYYRSGREETALLKIWKSSCFRKIFLWTLSVEHFIHTRRKIFFILEIYLCHNWLGSRTFHAKTSGIF